MYEYTTLPPEILESRVEGGRAGVNQYASKDGEGVEGEGSEGKGGGGGGKRGKDGEGGGGGEGLGKGGEEDEEGGGRGGSDRGGAGEGESEGGENEKGGRVNTYADNVQVYEYGYICTYISLSYPFSFSHSLVFYKYI